MPPKKVDKNARRQAILGAAAETFARSGYRQTTIEAVAEAAGIGKGSVYLYFGSKEDLFFALFEQLCEASMHVTAEQTEAAAGGAAERIFGLFMGVMHTIDASPEMIPLTLEFWSAAGLEETRNRFAPRYAQFLEEFRGMLSGIIEEGVARGEFRAGLPVSEIASCLMAIIDGLLLQQWTEPGFRGVVAMEAALPVLLDSLRGER